MALPEVTAGAEEGFHDLTFALVDRETLATGNTRLRAEGKHGAAHVQFDIELPSAWKDFDRPPLRMLSGAVAVKRIGNDHSLVHVLNDVYETKLAPNAMKETTTLKAIALEGDPRTLDHGPVRIKLFYESNVEDDYAEFFLNVDAAKRIVELREKDPEYRRALVRAFTQ